MEVSRQKNRHRVVRFQPDLSFSSNTAGLLTHGRGTRGVRILSGGLRTSPQARGQRERLHKGTVDRKEPSQNVGSLVEVAPLSL